MTGVYPPTAPRSRIGSDPARGRSPQPPGDFLLTLWTDDPVLAGFADSAGIDRIGLDLEITGKRERQRGLGTRISEHRIERLADVGAALTRARLFARVNPLSDDSRAEVETALALGAQVLMLPMFRAATEVRRFAELVAGRAVIVPLLETAEAAADAAAVAELEAIDELHVGINDLALSLGLSRRFEVFDRNEVRHVARCAHDAGVRFGIGGVGRVDDTSLPIPPDLVYAQYPRLGATAALVSRAFVRADIDAAQLARDVALCRERVAHMFARGRDELDEMHRCFREAVDQSVRW